MLKLRNVSVFVLFPIPRTGVFSHIRRPYLQGQYCVIAETPCADGLSVRAFCRPFVAIPVNSA